MTFRQVIDQGQDIEDDRRTWQGVLDKLNIKPE
ncbi:hypothetical protein J2W96_002053 [Variovorax guangxiensis]|nr:hypothetical protein [Variovorax guangxiensis]